MADLDLRDNGYVYSYPEPKRGMKVRWYSIWEAQDISIGDTVIWKAQHGDTRAVVTETGCEYTPRRAPWFEATVTEAPRG